MEADTLIRKIYMDCPLCDKVHDVEERKRMTTITLKGVRLPMRKNFIFVQMRMKMKTNLKQVQ